MLLMFRRRHAGAAVATLGVFSVALAGLVASSGSAAASVGSDKTDMTQLEQQIAAQGARAQSLVSRYNEAQARVNALDAQIAHDRRILADDQRVEAAATATLRRVAIKAYVSGTGMDSPALTMFSGTSSVTTMLEQNQYLGAVNDKFDNALTALHLDQGRTQDAQHGLEAEQGQARETLRQLTKAHDAATAAIAADEAKLSHISGDLRSLLAAASERQHAAEVAAEERALAAAPKVAPSEPTLPTPVPTTTPPRSSFVLLPSRSATQPTEPPPSSSGGYANPLRAVTALSSERIDQGVDYSGFGPVYAIGDGVVLSTVGSGWPSGTFIAYRLTDGPARGLVVYVAEDIEPGVQVGATVTSSTVLGQMFAGPSGIETGWADGSSLPDTMARTYGQFDGSNSTAFGHNFSQLLQSVGAPGGILSGPPSGTLPASWPRW
jgi:murein DD-endopeptidase MepM/ murein hydrolase activator NlpD